MNEPSKTIIGERTTINGNLEGDEDLLVQGRIEGSVALKHTLTIEPSGVVLAEVQVRHAVISGIMVGNITADDSVHITSQGRMVGDINAPRVIIVDGASFRGNVDMGNLDLPRPAEGTAHPARSAPVAFKPAPARAAARPPAAAPKPVKPEAAAPGPETTAQARPAAPAKPAQLAREADKAADRPRAPLPKAPILGKRKPALRRR